MSKDSDPKDEVYKAFERVYRERRRGARAAVREEIPRPQTEQEATDRLRDLRLNIAHATTEARKHLLSNYGVDMKTGRFVRSVSSAVLDDGVFRKEVNFFAYLVLCGNAINIQITKWSRLTKRTSLSELYVSCIERAIYYWQAFGALIDFRIVSDYIRIQPLLGMDALPITVLSAWSASCIPLSDEYKITALLRREYGGRITEREALRQELPGAIAFCLPDDVNHQVIVELPGDAAQQIVKILSIELDARSNIGKKAKDDGTGTPDGGKRSKAQQVESPKFHFDRVDSAYAESEARENVSAFLRQAQSCLSTRQYDVLVLMVLEKTESEIANELNITVGSVRQHIKRMRIKLRPLVPLFFST